MPTCRAPSSYGSGSGTTARGRREHEPVGRAYHGFSTPLCVPNAMSQPGGYTLGAQVGEAAIRRPVTQAGFTRFRRAAESPFNRVYEVRP